MARSSRKAGIMRLNVLHPLSVGLMLFLIPLCVFAASPPQAKPVNTADFEPDQKALLDELDEVVVNGQKPARKVEQLINWLASLGGAFTFEGNVDLHGKGNPEDLKPVEGSANCVAFGVAPGIRCEIKVRWPESRGPTGEAIPGGVSTLNPGMILYGIEAKKNGIRYMIVDNKGSGESAVGLLFNNTLISKSPCASDHDNCQRAVRITVEPDIQVIRMQINTQKDSKNVLGFDFVMRRVKGSKADVLQGLPK